jgi:hypothetical protein
MTVRMVEFSQSAIGGLSPGQMPGSGKAFNGLLDKLKSTPHGQGLPYQFTSFAQGLGQILSEQGHHCARTHASTGSGGTEQTSNSAGATADALSGEFFQKLLQAVAGGQITPDQALQLIQAAEQGSAQQAGNIASGTNGLSDIFASGTISQDQSAHAVDGTQNATQAEVA